MNNDPDTANNLSLRKQIRRVERQLTSTLTTVSGQGDDDAVPAEFLERATQLRTALDSLHYLARRRDRSVVFLLGAVFVLVVILIATQRVPSVTIQADLTVSAVQFIVNGAAIPLDRSLLEFQANGFSEADFPVHRPSLGPLGEPIVLGGLEGTSTHILLQQFSYEGRGLITVRKGDRPGGIAIMVEGIDSSSAGELLLTTMGRLTLLTGGVSSEVVAPRGSPFVLRLDQRRFDADAILTDTLTPVLQDVVIDSIEFVHRDEFPAPGRAVSVTRSTVVRGVVRFPALPSKTVSLGHGEHVELLGHQLSVRSLGVSGDGLRLSIAGRARSIRVGVDSPAEDLRPTYLTWLYNHDSVRFFQITLMVGVAALASFIRWLRG
jgi:hypothetical protein